MHICHVFLTDLQKQYFNCKNCSVVKREKLFKIVKFSSRASKIKVELETSA